MKSSPKRLTGYRRKKTGPSRRRRRDMGKQRWRDAGPGHKMSAEIAASRPPERRISRSRSASPAAADCRAGSCLGLDPPSLSPTAELPHSRANILQHAFSNVQTQSCLPADGFFPFLPFSAHYLLFIHSPPCILSQ